MTRTELSELLLLEISLEKKIPIKDVSTSDVINLMSTILVNNFDTDVFIPMLINVKQLKAFS